MAQLEAVAQRRRQAAPVEVVARLPALAGGQPQPEVAHRLLRDLGQRGDAGGAGGGLRSRAGIGSPASRASASTAAWNSKPSASRRKVTASPFAWQPKQ